MDACEGEFGAELSSLKRANKYYPTNPVHGKATFLISFYSRKFQWSQRTRPLPNLIYRQPKGSAAAACGCNELIISHQPREKDCPNRRI